MEPRAHLTPGKPLTLGAGIRRIVAPNAGPMTGPGTNTYLLGQRDIVVLDPGPDDSAHLEAILGACDGTIRWIVVTHTHRDHSPLAARLAEQSGAELIGMPPPRDGRQDETFVPHRIPGDDERLELGDVALIAIHTPGHASNCVCYLQPTERLLFTGDHVLEGVSPVIPAPDGDMAAYLASLDKLVGYDFERIAPGHGGVMERGPRIVTLLRAHRLAREKKVLAALARLRTSTLEALVPAVYDDVPSSMHPWAQLTLEAHLIKLERGGQVMRNTGQWRLPEA